MSPDERRREAFDELRELLAEGSDVDVAIRTAANSSGLREEVIRQIGRPLVEQQERLIAARRESILRRDRRLRADKVIDLYKKALSIDLNTDVRLIEEAVGISDFSRDEESDLFLKQLDAWLDEGIRD